VYWQEKVLNSSNDHPISLLGKFSNMLLHSDLTYLETAAQQLLAKESSKAYNDVIKL